jgi:site-specific recombinase XerD
MHADLKALPDVTASDHLTYLTPAFGKPLTAASFTKLFRNLCSGAGLPKGASAYAVRKAACPRLAEAGCSANEIAAISGHVSLREVERYTKAADHARMARSAIDGLAQGASSTGCYKLLVPKLQTCR